MDYGRYEYHDPSAGKRGSHKFWTCEPNGDGTVRISWGRIGTQGQTQIKDESHGIKKIREKIAKGYQLTEKYEEPSKRKRKTRAEKTPAPAPKKTKGLTPFQQALKDLE